MSKSLGVLSGRDWQWCLGTAAASSIVFLAFSYLSNPLYQGQAVALPISGASSGTALYQLPGSIAELASLAGIVGSGGNDAESLQTLKSRSLAERIVIDKGLIETLGEPGLINQIFGRSTDSASDVMLARAVRRFRDDAVTIVEDKRSGVIFVNVFWSDPQTAAELANDIVRTANRELQTRAISESRRKLDYLEQEAQRTNVIAVRDAVNRVIESEIQAITLANARSEFAFRMIDPAVEPEPDDYARPRRSAYFAVGFLLGGITAFMLRRRMHVTSPSG